MYRGDWDQVPYQVGVRAGDWQGLKGYPLYAPTLLWERNGWSWARFKEDWKAKASSSLALPGSMMLVSGCVCQLSLLTRRTAHSGYFRCINSPFTCLCMSESTACTPRLGSCGQNFMSSEFLPPEKPSRCQEWDFWMVYRFRKRLNPGDSFPRPAGLKRSFHVVCRSSCLLYLIFILLAFTPL